MRSLKVLILEPNPFQLMALHQMLNAIGIYDVLTASSLASALCSLGIVAWSISLFAIRSSRAVMAWP